MNQLSGLFIFDPCQSAWRRFQHLFDAKEHSLTSNEPRSARLIHDGAMEHCAGRHVAWNGRLDNAPELRRRLQLPDACAEARVALAAFLAGGAQALGGLIGDWSLCIADPAARRVVLASDYTGVRPLYYWHGDGVVAWSSRLDQLLDWTGDREWDDDYLCEYLIQGGSAFRTPYRGVRAVPPAHCVTAGPDGCTVQRIWQPDLEKSIRYADERDYEEQFRSLFREAVQVRMNTRGPVFAELSGGLDSTAIVCTAARLLSESAVNASRLVTVTYLDRNSPDEKFYRHVEETLALESVHIDVADFPYFQPQFAGGALPQPWSTRNLKLRGQMEDAGASVLMTGQLGDLTMGNWEDDSEQVADLLRAGRVGTAVRAALDWAVVCRQPVYSVLWRSLRSSLPAALRGPEFRWTPNHEGLSLTPEWRRRAREVVCQPDVGGCDIAARRKRAFALLYQMQARRLQAPESFDAAYTHPYSHRPLVEFILAIPAEVVAAAGQPRRLMRRALRGWMPDAVLGRRSKASFERVFRQSLAPLAAELLRDLGNSRLVQRGIIHGPHLEGRLRRYLSGLESNSGMLRSVLMLEFWLRGLTDEALRRASSDLGRAAAAGAIQSDSTLASR